MTIEKDLVAAALAEMITKPRRVAVVCSQELALIDAVLSGRVSRVAAGRALGFKTSSAVGGFMDLLWRAAAAGYYVRSDKGVPEP